MQTNQLQTGIAPTKNVVTHALDKKTMLDQMSSELSQVELSRKNKLKLTKRVYS